MSKNTFFTGQPIFNQLLSLIPKRIIFKSVQETNSDRYYKKFKSYDHLITMLFTCLQKCTSLREVTTGMMVCQHKLFHLGIVHSPRRSTIADANNKRSCDFFSSVYSGLYHHYYRFSPDSRLKGSIENRLFLIDSTTISLFTEIMKGAGSKGLNGKKKGGAKAHLVVKASEDVPVFAMITHASKNDRDIFKNIELPAGAIAVFDKGYNSYKQFEKWSRQSVTWITRMRHDSSQELVKSYPVSSLESNAGVLSDQMIILGRISNRKTKRINVRKICYNDKEKNRTFTFITNNFKYKASKIASIYKRRWQIELLFKRLKQTYPLRYFLGESENAIKTQIWCALISDLLLKIIKDKINKKWSYANLSGMIRLHLMNYMDLLSFLKNPEKSLLHYNEPKMDLQLKLFNTT
jgi:transposase